MFSLLCQYRICCPAGRVIYIFKCPPAVLHFCFISPCFQAEFNSSVKHLMCISNFIHKQPHNQHISPWLLSISIQQNGNNDNKVESIFLYYKWLYKRSFSNQRNKSLCQWTVLSILNIFLDALELLFRIKLIKVWLNVCIMLQNSCFYDQNLINNQSMEHV